MNDPATTTAPVGRKAAAAAKKKLAQQQTAAAAAAAAAASASTAAAVGNDNKNDNDNDTPATTFTAKTIESSTPMPAAKSFPGEPEEHLDGDVVESAIRHLKGSRPELLRTSTYYKGAKGIYMCLAGLPVLSSIAPTVEAVAENVINMTPLKPSPEEAEQRSIAIFDKKISEALSFADEVVDTKKDEAIEGIVTAKKVVNTLGPVQSLVGMVHDVTTTAGSAVTNATDATGSVLNSARTTAESAVQNVTETTGGILTSARKTAEWAMHHTAETTGGVVNAAVSTAESAVKYATDTTGGVFDSARTTVGGAVDYTGYHVKSMVGSIGDNIGSTYNGATSMAGSIADNIGSNLNWATSTATAIGSAAIAYPMGFMQSLLSNDTKPKSEA